MGDHGVNGESGGGWKLRFQWVGFYVGSELLINRHFPFRSLSIYVEDRRAVRRCLLRLVRPFGLVVQVHQILLPDQMVY